MGTRSAALRNSFSSPVWRVLPLPSLPSPWRTPTAPPLWADHVAQVEGKTLPHGSAPLHTHAPTSWDEVGPMHHRKPLLAPAPGGSQSGRNPSCTRAHVHEPQQHPRLLVTVFLPHCVQTPAFLGSTGDQLEPELAEGHLLLGTVPAFSIFLLMWIHAGAFPHQMPLWPAPVGHKPEAASSAGTRNQSRSLVPRGPTHQLKVLPGI